MAMESSVATRQTIDRYCAKVGVRSARDPEPYGLRALRMFEAKELNEK